MYNKLVKYAWFETLDGYLAYHHFKLLGFSFAVGLILCHVW